jgi:hypothetical protein
MAAPLATAPAAPAPASQLPRAGDGRGNGFRSAAGVSLGLLLSINLFNYIDRQVLAAVESDIAKDVFGPAHESPATLTKMGALGTAFLVS